MVNVPYSVIAPDSASIFQALRAQVTGSPDQVAKSSKVAGAYAAR
ncbi:hypothetical protein GCM10020219_033320 [Nonomuraea dietziae]